jgi:hypothetical protein
MENAKIYLKSITPYSQGKYHETEKKNKENHNDYEKRTWREKMHINKNGNVFIPLTSIKNCLSEAAKYLSIQIPGKGKSTYTKHFEAGILVEDHIVLDYKKDEVDCEWVFVPSDGKRGGTRRVNKCFPYFPEWEGNTIVKILDQTITREVFELHLKEAGRFIGLGRFRPRNNGYYGRFEVIKIEWDTI